MSRSSPPTLVFDVFRTLVEFDGDHVDAATWRWMSSWLAYRGISRTPHELQRAISASTERHLDAAPSPTPDVDVLEVWDDVLAGDVPDTAQRADLVRHTTLEWRQVTTRSIGVWPGAEAMLRTARDAGARLAVASNTQRAYTAAELRMLGLDGFFEVIVFSSDVRACKPDPAVLRRACDLLDTPPAEVVYIGDNPLDDVEAAHALGAASVLLDRGTQPAAPPRRRPDVVIEDGDGVAAVRAALELVS